MGCRSSKQHNGDIFNEENIFNEIRRKLLTGIQLSKDTNGIEGNFQIAFGKTNKIRYEKVTSAPPVEEQPGPEEEK